MYIYKIDDSHRSVIMIKYIKETETEWTSYFCCKAPMDNLAQFQECYSGLCAGDITLTIRVL